MPGLMIAWTVALGLVALVWASRHVAISRARAGQQVLSSTSHAAGWPGPTPRISVLVAAKDEEDNIEACVASFLEQDYPDFEVIVIDDRSTDRTPGILARMQSGHGERLRVLTIHRLREGWFGKSHAMHEGVAVAAGSWLCFADADCRQTSPHTLTMAMREVQASGADFLSVLPVLETRTFWERVVQPVCAAVMVYWFHPDRVNDPKHPAAYANGAFMLMKREVYDSIGGHERVRKDVNEDIQFARLAKGMGFSLRVVPQDDLYVTRMYASLRQIWNGWSRIFRGCLGSYRRLGVALLLLATFSLGPWASLVAAGLGAALGPTGVGDAWGTVLLAAAAAVAMQQSVMVRFYRLSRLEPAWSAFYVVGALICFGTLINAMLKLAGASALTWRGTTYRNRQVDQGLGGSAPPPDPAAVNEAGVHGP